MLLLLTIVFLPCVLFFILFVLFKIKKSFWRSFLYSFLLSLLFSIVWYLVVGIVVYKDVTGLMTEFQDKEMLVVLEDKGVFVEGFLSREEQAETSGRSSGINTDTDTGDSLPLTIISQNPSLKEQLKAQDYATVRKQYLLIVVDMSIYEVLPAQIEFNGNRIARKDLEELLRAENMSAKTLARITGNEKMLGLLEIDTSPNDVKSRKAGTIAATPKKNIEENIDPATVKTMAFLLLTQQLAEEEGFTTYLIEEFQNGDIQILTEHTITLRLLRSLPTSALTSLGEQVWGDTENIIQ